MTHLVIILLIVIAVALFLAFRAKPAAIRIPPGIPQPVNAAPPPKQPPDCNVPSVPVVKEAGQRTVQDIRGGIFAAERIVLGGNNDLEEDLLLVGDSMIEIAGNLTMASVLGPSSRSTNITIACPNGDVWIRAGCTIDGTSPAPYGTTHNNGTGLAQGGAGTNGAHIVIIATNIIVDGKIIGNEGGAGGGSYVVAGTIPGRTDLGTGCAVAVGGNGGHGGDVLLCALETIRRSPGASITGARPSPGGRADTLARQDSDTFAGGGDAGTPGDIRFVDRGGACQVRIAQGASVETQWEQKTHPLSLHNGGNATAGHDTLAPNTTGAGGRAEAIGGRGSDGAAITFTGCTVDNLGTVRAGDAGHGGSASAFGGEGMTDIAGNGRNGGNAKASAGFGGTRSPDPTFTAPNGNPDGGMRGASGRGGNANATAGTGGDGAPGQTGGSSGDSEAHGGNNGDGTTSGKDETLKPVTPLGNAGGKPWGITAKGA